MSPALAGGFLTTAPPGKPSLWDLNSPNTTTREVSVSLWFYICSLGVEELKKAL